MAFEETIILRVGGDLKDRLTQLALDAGVSQSAIARYILSIAFEKPREKSDLEKITEKFRKKLRAELYGDGEETKQ